MHWFQVHIGIPVMSTVGCQCGAFSELAGLRKSSFHVGIQLCCQPLSHEHTQLNSSIRVPSYSSVAKPWGGGGGEETEGGGNNFLNYLILASVWV